MSLPDMQKPAEPSVEHTLKFHDGSTRKVYVCEREVAFPDGHLIISRVDLNGILTHANDAFVVMSGYERDELIGSPHCILRHPDMPSAAFNDLWETLQAGKKWLGYVKNLRKDGAYYWVYATAVPNVRNGKTVGYTSVRRRPSRNKINELLPVYADWRKQEGVAA